MLTDANATLINYPIIGFFYEGEIAINKQTNFWYVWGKVLQAWTKLFVVGYGTQKDLNLTVLWMLLIAIKFKSSISHRVPAFTG